MRDISWQKKIKAEFRLTNSMLQNLTLFFTEMNSQKVHDQNYCNFSTANCKTWEIMWPWNFLRSTSLHSFCLNISPWLELTSQNCAFKPNTFRVTTNLNVLSMELIMLRKKYRMHDAWSKMWLPGNGKLQNVIFEAEKFGLLKNYQVEKAQYGKAHMAENM